MNATFVDTSFLIALLLEPDEHHERALGWQDVITGPLLTTDFVLVEFVDALCTKQLRRRAFDGVAELRADPLVRVVPASTAVLNDGLAFFGRHADKEWSLTDCISFVVMRREGVHEALSSDHNFEQAGFRALLRSDPPGR